MFKLENSFFVSPTALIDSGHINQWMKALDKRFVGNFIMERLGYHSHTQHATVASLKANNHCMTPDVRQYEAQSNPYEKFLPKKTKF